MSELDPWNVRAALNRVKYQFLAGLVLSGAAGFVVYDFEARAIRSETRRITAEQIGNVEERIVLAHAELESAAAMISQAHPQIPVLKQFIDGLALSKAGNVPWLWAFVVTGTDIPALEAAIRQQPSMEAFKVKPSGTSQVLAPVVFAEDSREQSLIGSDLLSNPELAKLASDPPSKAVQQATGLLLPIAFPGLPPDAIYMVRYFAPDSRRAGGLQIPSLVLRGVTADNLEKSAQLLPGQSLRLEDRSVNPPRPLMLEKAAEPEPQWFPPTEFSVGQHRFAVSLSAPRNQGYPLWWLLATTVGILLTGVYTALRSGFIVGARASQLGSILTSTEQRLAETQRREIAFFENAGTANCEVDFGTGRLMRANESLCHMLGYDREELLSKTFVELTHPDDVSLTHTNLFDENGKPKSRLEYEKRYVRKDGTSLWALVNSKIYYDVNGEPKSYMTVIINIDGKKRDEATKALLTRELAHRVRNTVQLTSSLARQTAATAKSVKDYDQKFHRRLSALSAAQDILFDRNWMSAPLSRIAQAIIKPFHPEDKKQGELALNLPDVELSTQQAQTIAIALHELASNSSKFGALSNGGKVSVTGTLEEALENGGRMLHLTWDEQSSNPVRKPRRSGFGTRMLMSAMPEQFEGRADVTWRSTGLLYEAWLKLPQL